MTPTATAAMHADPTACLTALRAEFPHFGIVADPARPIWMAVRGDALFVRASDAVTLRQRLQQLSGR
ncbi:hypothetical protein [Actinomadura litoris]|uniref:hypothetical protein n=1 Tax=Actinomadura litoris TaxID=2678616 RepID=UPI001FA759C8|nr:hypothetical protein [Actinomadura litoris]